MRLGWLETLQRALAARPAAGRDADGASGDALCHVLVCYRSTEFVAFLLASLYRRQDLFLVHCDPKAPEDLKAYIARLARCHRNVVRLEPQPYSWAGYSHVAVTLRALRLGLARSRAWGHLICLSEEHLPLRGPDAIAAALRGRGSLVATRPAEAMTGWERADLENRFAAVYRELPGVGCFATGLAPRAPEFWAGIRHGSNWMILARADAAALVAAEARGAFQGFEGTVHAEETAIPSVLAGLGRLPEPFDATLVAYPYRTDNDGLVACDGLFRWATGTEHLFIRKRPDALSPPMRAHVMGQHHHQPVYAMRLERPRRWFERPRAPDADRIRAEGAGIAADLPAGASLELIDPARAVHSPRLHAVVRSTGLREGLSVRVLSQTPSAYKVCLVDSRPGEGVHLRPFVARGRLHATIRARLFDLFGRREIVPLDRPEAGFVTLGRGRSLARVAAEAAAFLEAGLALSREEGWGSDAAGAGDGSGSTPGA